MNNFPPALQAVLARGWARRVHYLDIVLADGTPLHLSDDKFVFTALGGATTYQGDLRDVGGVKVSAYEGADRIEMSAQNVDKQLGLSTVEAEDALNNAVAYYGKILTSVRDPLGLSGPNAWKVARLWGKLTGAQAAEDVIRFSLVAAVSAAGLVAGNQPVQRLCRFRYKGLECGSLSLLPTCAHTFTGANSCAEHTGAQGQATNQHRYGGDRLFLPNASAVVIPPATDDDDLNRPPGWWRDRRNWRWWDVDGPLAWRHEPIRPPSMY